MNVWEVMEDMQGKIAAEIRVMLGEGPYDEKLFDDEQRARRIKAMRIKAMQECAAKSTTDAERHKEWMKMHEELGWKYGPQFRPDVKEHPNMLPWDDLPATTRSKSNIFAIVAKAAGQIAGAWLLVLLLASVCWSSDSGPAELSVTGPDATAVNVPVELVVVGLPAAQLDKPMGEQLKWMEQIKIVVNTPKGVDQGQWSLKKSLSLSVDPLAWQFTLKFQASKPGDFVVVIDWNLDPYGLALHRVQVGGGGPPPDPQDPVDPPPDPSQKTTRVTYVFEKDQNSPPRPVESALQKLNQSGVLASSFEEDTVDGDGQVPDQYKIALDAARKAGLPALVVESASGVKRVAKAPTTDIQVMEAAK